MQTHANLSSGSRCSGEKNRGGQKSSQASNLALWHKYFQRRKGDRRGVAGGKGLRILMLCLVLFHFQVYLIYLLYCPHGVLGMITIPLCPSASMSDSDGNWCFPFHQWTFSHQSLPFIY